MATKEVTFSKLFNQTWSEYKANFKPMFKFLFLFLGMLLILMTIIEFFWIFSDNTIYKMAINPNMVKEGLIIPAGYLITGLLLGLSYLVFYFFTTAGITSMSVQKTKYKLNEITKVAKASWLKYVGFVIVTTFFIFLLSLLFIIPGIIFAVYWMFAAYILFYEKEGILVSLQKSKQLIKGHWWQVFGYVFLIMLIIWIIQAIISAPIMLIQNKIININISTVSLILMNSYRLIINFVSILMYPFLVLFLKNFYFALKGKKQAVQPVSS